METVKDNFVVNDEALNNVASGGVEDAIEDVNYDNIKIPSLDKILEMVQGMDGISDEEKSSLINEMLSQSGGAGIGGIPAPAGPIPVPQSIGYQFILLFILLFVVACIFVLFGYKLYKSIIEKERKREEKRKQKQMKKKK
ncbi:uncharacterized protein LOC123300120 [Chrysoperla carnea]|uniref:uncharacterized protein LOC123300120 n=1 Tax=Chrysoperla carnea TaxID=189513 RepID=UPI001D05D0E5|nr:uncharacterized protein LOC123300120 [Chrysoperla carnea]